MTSKPFYLSLTIVGAIVHLFITLAALFGVDLGDQADAITKTIEQVTLAASALFATGSTIVGRIRARKQITLGRIAPSVKSLLLLGLVIGTVGALVGCAPLPSSATVTTGTGAAASTPITTSTNTTPVSAPAPSILPIPSSIVTGGISLTTSAALTAYLDFGVNNTATRERLAGYIYTGATLTLQLAGNQSVTPSQFQTYLTTYGVQNDADYASVASEITSLYSAFLYPKIQSGSGPAIDAYLTAFASGLQSGAAVYAPSTVLASASTTTTTN